MWQRTHTCSLYIQNMPFYKQYVYFRARYVHPFTAPMGPQQTRTVKSQRLKWFGAHGLILQTTTHLEDIMMSDYFQIEDT
jgi:VAD1 Analog of StAR-related lipid transfer domain